MPCGKGWETGAIFPDGRVSEQSGPSALTGSGAILGVATAVLLGAGIYRGGVSVNLVRLNRFAGGVLAPWRAA